MFSVPGWNVSAPLTAQIEKPKVKEAKTNEKKSKKRKRQQDELVNEANVGELWSKVAEGENAGAQEKATVVVAKEGEDKVEAVAPEARKKPRKRSKKKKDTTDGDAPVDNAAEVEKEDITTSAEAPIAVAEKAATTDDVEAPTTVAEKAIPDADAIAQARRDKKKRKEENRAAKQAQAQAQPPAPTKLVPAVSLIPEPPGLTPMQRSMRTKLASARFRHLNESLYTLSLIHI